MLQQFQRHDAGHRLVQGTPLVLQCHRLVARGQRGRSAQLQRLDLLQLRRLPTVQLPGLMSQGRGDAQQADRGSGQRDALDRPHALGVFPQCNATQPGLCAQRDLRHTLQGRAGRSRRGRPGQPKELQPVGVARGFGPPARRDGHAVRPANSLHTVEATHHVQALRVLRLQQNLGDELDTLLVATGRPQRGLGRCAVPAQRDPPGTEAPGHHLGFRKWLPRKGLHSQRRVAFVGRQVAQRQGPDAAQAAGDDDFAQPFGPRDVHVTTVAVERRTFTARAQAPQGRAGTVRFLLRHLARWGAGGRVAR